MILTRQPGTASLAEIERVLEEACGLTLSPGIRRTLGDAFARAARELGLTADGFLRALRDRENRAVTALVEAAVIGETYFFRHPEQLALVRRLVLDPAPRDRPLSIWSAGCATGEEPYTLAMALWDAGRVGAGDQILATDVSARALSVARLATYGEWSLRRLDPTLRARHFESHPPRVVVRAALRSVVEFRRHNLVKEMPPATGFDLVLCRNVLIYFTPPTAALVVERLVSALRPGGTLVLGPVEAPLAANLGLTRIEMDGATLLRLPEPGEAAAPRSARPLLELRRRGTERAPRAVPRVRREPPRVAVVAPSPGAAAASPPPRAEDAEPTAPPPAANGPAADGALLAAAREAAHHGDLDRAEALARRAAAEALCPEAWLLVSMAADARGDVSGAVEAVRRALYLDPGLALGHATLVPLFARLGLSDEAARARRNALEAIAGLDDAAPLRGLETITAGALRAALEAQLRPARQLGTSTGSDG